MAGNDKQCSQDLSRDLSGFEGLPSEVLQQILRHLDSWGSLCSMQCVSSTCRTAVYSIIQHLTTEPAGASSKRLGQWLHPDAMTYRAVLLHSQPQQDAGASAGVLQERVEAAGTSSNSLQQQQLFLQLNRSTTDSFIRGLLHPKLSRLTALSIRDISDFRNCYKQLATFSGLTSLTMASACLVDEDLYVLLGGRLLCDLRHLDLSGNLLNGMEKQRGRWEDSSMTAVETASSSFHAGSAAAGQQPSVFSIIAQQCSRLTSLCLSNNPRLTSLGALGLPAAAGQGFAAQLQCLDLDGCRLEPQQLPQLGCCRSISVTIKHTDVRVLTEWLLEWGRGLQQFELYAETDSFGLRLLLFYLLVILFELLAVQCAGLVKLRICGSGTLEFPYYLVGSSLQQTQAQHCHLEVTRRYLAALAPLSQLSALDLEFCGVAGTALLELSAIARLASVSFKQVFFTKTELSTDFNPADAGSLLEALSSVQGLTNLSVERCWQPADVAELWDGVGHLRFCNFGPLTSLRQLRVWNCTPWLPDIACLSSLRSLTSLELKLLDGEVHTFKATAAQDALQLQQEVHDGTDQFSVPYQQLLSHCVLLLIHRISNQWDNIQQQLQAEALLQQNTVQAALRGLQSHVNAVLQQLGLGLQVQAAWSGLLLKLQEVYEDLLSLCDATPALNRYLQWVQRSVNSEGFEGYSVQDSEAQAGSDEDAWLSDGDSLDSADEFGDDYDLRGYGANAAAAEWEDEAVYDFEVAGQDSDLADDVADSSDQHLQTKDEMVGPQNTEGQQVEEQDSHVEPCKPELMQESGKQCEGPLVARGEALGTKFNRQGERDVAPRDIVSDQDWRDVMSQVERLARHVRDGGSGRLATLPGMTCSQIHC